MVYYSCGWCEGQHEQVHIVLAEDETGIIVTLALCDDCCDNLDFDYEYLMTLKNKEEDKYGLFS